MHDSDSEDGENQSSDDESDQDDDESYTSSLPESQSHEDSSLCDNKSKVEVETVEDEDEESSHGSTDTKEASTAELLDDAEGESSSVCTLDGEHNKPQGDHVFISQGA